MKNTKVQKLIADVHQLAGLNDLEKLLSDYENAGYDLDKDLDAITNCWLCGIQDAYIRNKCLALFEEWSSN